MASRKNKNKKNKRVSRKTPELGANAFKQVILGWHAPEFLRYERGWLWYTLMLLLDAALIAYAYWTSSWSMLVVFVVLPIVLILHHRKHPKMVKVLISAYGIKFGKRAMAFSDIRKFWIINDDKNLNELHLLTSSRIHPEVVIPMLDLDPAVVRHILVQQVPEWEGKEESFLDTLIRFLKLA